MKPWASGGGTLRDPVGRRQARRPEPASTGQSSSAKRLGADRSARSECSSARSSDATDSSSRTRSANVAKASSTRAGSNPSSACGSSSVCGSLLMASATVCPPLRGSDAFAGGQDLPAHGLLVVEALHLAERPLGLLVDRPPALLDRPRRSRPRRAAVPRRRRTRPGRRVCREPARAVRAARRRGRCRGARTCRAAAAKPPDSAARPRAPPSHASPRLMAPMLL